MRRHRRIILVLIIVFISIPFVIWVAPQGGIDPAMENEATVIATVGDVPVYDWQLVRALEAQADAKARELQREDPLTFRELEEQGFAKEVLNDLISVALFRKEIDERNFEVDRAVLEKKLRDEPMFQDTEGKFDPATFNRWVQESRINWNDLYQDLNRQVAHEIYVEQLTASAGHVSPAEIDKLVAARHTKIKVKYAKIEPPIEISDAEVRAYYDENTENYRDPAQKTARFIAVSLEPEVPANAADIVAQARGGADFAALIAEHSFIKPEAGVEPEWTPRPIDPGDTTVALHDLEIGAVTDPLPVVGGFRIYKVLDKRVNEATGEAEIKYSDIYLRAQVTEEERTARTKLAADIMKKAEETGSLEEAAAAFGRQVQESGAFTSESVEVGGLSREDVRQFTTAFAEVEDTAIFKNVQGRSNLYVARLASVEPGAIPPFEDVQLEVRDDLRQARKQELPFKEKVEEYVAKLEGQVSSLDQIKTQYPELNLEIFESKEITGREFIFENNAFLQGQAIYDAVGDGEPGTVGGPVRGFDGSVYFVELIQKTPPTDADQEQIAADKKSTRENLVANAQNELLEDYLLYLNQVRLAQAEVNVDFDQEAYNRIVGVSPGETDAVPVEETPDALPPEGPMPVDDAAVTEAPAETPAADAPPAEAPVIEVTPAEAPAQ